MKRWMLILAVAGGAAALGSCDLLDDLTAPQFLGCSDISSYDIGTAVDGELKSGDCETDNGRLFHLYEFSVDTTRQEVTFLVRSEEFDPYLELYDADTVQVNYDNDSGRGMDGKDAQMSVTLLQGTYYVRVRALLEGEIGSYRLTTTTPQIGFKGCLALTSISAGQTLTRSLESGDCIDGIRYAEYFTLMVDSLRTVYIKQASEDFDAVMSIYDRESGSYISGSDDNAGGISGHDAGISERLTPGEYVIRAYTYNTAEIGSYRLAVTTPGQGFRGCTQVASIALTNTVEASLTTEDCVAWGRDTYTD